MDAAKIILLVLQIGADVAMLVHLLQRRKRHVQGRRMMRSLEIAVHRVTDGPAAIPQNT